MQNRTWREEVREYIPYNSQEQEDKAQFLEVIDQENILFRENEQAHISASGFVMNEMMDQVLMAYHNIYQSFSWLGGHADGDPDLFAVAMREVQEESGIASLTPFSREIIALDILPVPAHMKRGKPVCEHLHLNVTYLFIADTSQTLTVKEDENSDVAWIRVEDLPEKVTEERMLPVYRKIVQKARQWKAQKEIRQ